MVAGARVGSSLQQTPPAVIAGNFANPVGTASSVPVMAGLGILFTPKKTGKMLLNIDGMAASATAVATVTLQGVYGTGTPPVNGAAAVGTAYPQGPFILRATVSATTSGLMQFSLFAVLTGLILGTTYWTDLTMMTGTPADITVISNGTYMIQESS